MYELEGLKHKTATEYVKSVSKHTSKNTLQNEPFKIF
jgi:hypothetical protein